MNNQANILYVRSCSSSVNIARTLGQRVLSPQATDDTKASALENTSSHKFQTSS